MFKSSRLAAVLGALSMLLLFASMQGVLAQQSTAHRLVLQVDTEDTQTMNITLANAINAKKYYDEKGQSVTIEIVTYGPGITMFRSDTSPVKERLNEARKSIPDLALTMCGNAKAGAEKREGRAIIPLDGVKVVPAGIVRIMELQEQGYSYVRP